MRPKRVAFPLILVASGLLGISLFMIGDRSHWAIIPADDFAKGLWFGVCLGVELLGGLLMVKDRAKVAS
jgi:hypothetical protein